MLLAPRLCAQLVRASKLPSLGRYADMADFLTGGGGMSSDSGGETDDEEKAELPQDYVGRHVRTTLLCGGPTLPHPVRRGIAPGHTPRRAVCVAWQLPLAQHRPPASHKA